MKSVIGFPKVTLITTEIDNLTMNEVLGRIEVMAAGPAVSHIITANVDHLMVKRSDPESEEVFRNAALIVPDGVPLLWAARFLGTPLCERINGTDLMERICELAARKHFPIFLLGAPPGIAAGAASNLQKRFPGLDVRGTYAPAYGFENDAQENERICSMLREKKISVLFVSLGLPKGIQWISRHQHACQVALAIEVGASFAFISGHMERAPRWMQKSGLEWLWRLILEPHRLWKRYLFNALPFLFCLLRQKFQRAKPEKK